MSRTVRTGIFYAPPAFFIVMSICDLKRGEAAIVLSVAAEPALRERMKILGVYAGARVKLLKSSLLRRTFLLSTGTGRAALGRSVAAGVKVCKVQ